LLTRAVLRGRIAQQASHEKEHDHVPQQHLHRSLSQRHRGGLLHDRLLAGHGPRDDLVKTVAAVKDSAVSIKQTTTDSWGHPATSYGAGSVIDAKRGYILTNAT